MKKLPLVTLFLFFAEVSLATEMVGALSAGMGGTGRASVEVNESLYLNPASLALMQGFNTGASYQSGFTSKNISRNTYSVALSDATEGVMLPGAFGYRRHNINGQGLRFKENEFRGGAAYRINDRVSFGLGVSHLRAENQTGVEFNQTNINSGILIGLQPNWGLSLTGENLLEGKEDLPPALVRLSRVALGTQYVHERTITFRYEALMPLYMENSQFLGHRAGIGFSLKTSFGLNLGYSVDDALAQNWSSIGLSWKGPRLKLAYSLQRENRSDLGTRHLVDLWLDI